VPAPRPGQPVRGSRTGRPIMARFDLVGRRWALRVLWELHRAPGALTFRALQGACDGVSSSVLTQRLAELRDARMVERGDGGYALTSLGADLVASLAPVARWSERWAAAR
jgi:DNA-binding HxlR family transcriptional regulator